MSELDEQIAFRRRKRERLLERGVEAFPARAPHDFEPAEVRARWGDRDAAALEAENLRLRSELMIGISELIRRRGWTQTVAAKHCGVAQPRLNDLLRGKIDRFSLDALVNIATSLGLRVQMKIHAA